MEESQEHYISVIGKKDDKLFVFTSADAPKYKLVTIDLKSPQRKNWKDLVPEDKDAVLVDAAFAGDQLILTYDKDASHRAYVYDKEGNRLREIITPRYGTLSFSTNSKDPETFYSYTSFTTPSTIM